MITESLHLAILRFSIIELFKIILEGFSSPTLLNLIPFLNNTHSRYKLSVNLIRKDVFKQYFIFRCISVWKILPDHYFNTNVTESFKLKLSKTDFSQFFI